MGISTAPGPEGQQPVARRRQRPARRLGRTGPDATLSQTFLAHTHTRCSLSHTPDLPHLFFSLLVCFFSPPPRPPDGADALLVYLAERVLIQSSLSHFARALSLNLLSLLLSHFALSVSTLSLSLSLSSSLYDFAHTNKTLLTRTFPLSFFPSLLEELAEQVLAQLILIHFRGKGRSSSLGIGLGDDLTLNIYLSL
jgi:hypothetical protein